MRNIWLILVFNGLVLNVQSIRDTAPTAWRRHIRHTNAEPFELPPRIETKYGNVHGNAIWLKENKQVHTFLGVPYARAPINYPQFNYNLRFQPPQEPQYVFHWYAKSYRPACPQHKKYLQTLKNQETSENCLFMNIFSPFYTDEPPFNHKLFPVMVYIHGGDFKGGSGQMFPADILAEEDLVVVTFNYRLNALGFLSTQDRHATGNYGFLDMIQALRYVNSQIRQFRGDPNRVTIVGHGSGGMAVGLLLVSPLSRDTGLFHRAIAMSGNDLCESAVIMPDYAPAEYARELAYKVGCPVENNDRMMDCLRNYRTGDEIALAAEDVPVRWGWYGYIGGPWGASIDGLNPGYSPSFLPEHPRVLRKKGLFSRVRLMAGIAMDDGSYYLKGIPNVANGLTRAQFRERISGWLWSRGVRDIQRVTDALETEYTYWRQPRNVTWRRQMMVDLYTDRTVGSCTDEVLKFSAKYNVTSMYLFNHTSNATQVKPDIVPPAWMGVYHGSEIQYIIGKPYLNDKLYNWTGIREFPRYNDLDKNISDYAITLWTNFAKYGNGTPVLVKNNTWLPFKLNNLTYLMVQNNTYVYKDYRQPYYAFWRNYFHLIAKAPLLTTTPFPTVLAPAEVRVSTWTLGGFAVLLIIIILAMGIALCHKRKPPYREEIDAEYSPPDLLRNNSF
ncbi:neuroligin-4, Y-linked-like [Tubulanus polymorphus]|uniref:neuroligin-4, Y-linked-like n=1 Tax=Tubulanus polymorphus TaxID=672921 RepID=UPI003DA5A251